MAEIKLKAPMPVKDMPLIQGPNGGYHRFGFEYQMEVSGASLSLRAVFDGEVIGSTTLKVKTD